MLKYTTPLLQLSIKVVSPFEFLSKVINDEEQEIFSVVVIDDGIEEIEEISKVIEEEMEERALYGILSLSKETREIHKL